MSYTHVITQRIFGDGRELFSPNPETVTSTAHVGFDEIWFDPTNLEMDIAVAAVANIKSIVILATQDTTFEINSNVGVGGSISLTANVPYIWTENSAWDLTDDITAVAITSVFITAVGTCRVQCDIIYDST